ncbi:MAG: Endoribonuclease YbeY [Verrucomicrobia subdivision 3 bacterium]|nr:Endoribonuclease YbeY [Limisphaerales bacterium]
MAAVNQKFLNHQGPTDVITFDLAEDPDHKIFLAQLYICPGVARVQAKKFETTWPDELIRYHVHALLHLKGYDDQTPAARRTIKRHEERIMRWLRKSQNLNQLERVPHPADVQNAPPNKSVRTPKPSRQFIRIDR